MHPLLDFLMFLAKLAFFYMEAIFRLFVPGPKRDITGQVVLVTGAGGGIGRQLAIKFSAEGAKLAITDISQDGLKATEEDLKIRGATVCSYVCDVTKIDDVKKLVSSVQKDLGDVNILVNNAGILIGKDILTLTEQDIRRTYDINSISHFWTVREVLPSMLARRQGHIVTIASMAGKTGTTLLVDYSASKFAAIGFSEALRAELMDLHADCDIKVTAVCPMFVNTNLIFGDEVKERVSYTDRFGKVLEPSDVAQAVVDGTLRGKFTVYVPANAAGVDTMRGLLPDKGLVALGELLATKFIKAK